jgi:uncharacterized protein
LKKLSDLQPKIINMIPPISEVPPANQQQSISELSSHPFSPRIPSLDVLRGIAILGALFVSIWIFGGFSSNQQTGLLLKSKGLNYRLFGAVDLLLEGKMKALIAIVFGAGMILFMSKENQKEKSSTADLFIRRQMWLILFGLINAIVFLWTGDLLFHLGIMGVLLFPFVRLSKRGLLIAATIAMIIYCGKNYWNYSDDRKAYNKYLAVTNFEKKIKKDSTDNTKKDSLLRTQKKDSLSAGLKTDSLSGKAKTDTLTKEQKSDKGAWEGKVNGMKYDAKKDDGEKKAMRSTSFGKLWNHLLPTTQFKEAAWTYQTGIWDFAGMILLGMALFKFGFFSSQFSRSRYLLIAFAGLTAGLLLGWLRLHNNQLTLQDYAKYIDHHRIPYTFFFPFEMAFMVLGYASLILFLLGSGPLNRLWRSFAYVGKMALTIYMMQTIICTLFFTGFGMGYFGRLSQYQLYIVAGEICLFQMAFSVLWLRRYYYGPAEWLLRCLMYRSWLPNKINKPVITESSVTAHS